MNDCSKVKNAVKAFVAVAAAALIALAIEVVVFNWQSLETASLSGTQPVSGEAYDSDGYHCIEYAFDNVELRSVELTSDLPETFDTYSLCSVFVVDEGSSVYSKLGDMWLGADSSHIIHPTGKVKKLLIAAAPVTPKVSVQAGSAATYSMQGGGGAS